MPKHLIKRYAPDLHLIREYRYLRIFGSRLQEPNLWHMNRRSVSGAFAVGLFWAFIPIPFQMVTAAATAILTKVNLPISVALVWITNPLTMPAMFYGNYLLGNWILGNSSSAAGFEPSMEWILESIGYIWQPLFLGGVICGLVAAALGYVAMRSFWRVHVIRRFRQKRQRGQA